MENEAYACAYSTYKPTYARLLPKAGLRPTAEVEGFFKAWLGELDEALKKAARA